MEQVNTFNDYRKQANEPFFESYNPGWQNQPNFSWKQNQPMGQGGAPHHAQSQYPLGFHGRSAQTAPVPQAPTRASLIFTVNFGRHSQGLHASHRPSDGPIFSGLFISLSIGLWAYFYVSMVVGI